MKEYSPIENSKSAKDFNATVVVKGDPRPAVFWELDGKDASTLGFKIEETSRTEGKVVHVTSIISKELTAVDNGVLTVITKHGELGDLGPTEKKTSQISVKCKIYCYQKSI